MRVKIALAGNPNSGKTTLFNALTGSNQFVGNWPGVTVEKKEGKIKGYTSKAEEAILVDLPGVYSLSPYTLEEVVSRNFLIGEKPDAIINIIDGTNLERNLYLTTQLTELGIPVIVAVNMMDLVRKNGEVLDIEKLGKDIGCKVVEISALRGEGIDQLAQRAVAIARGKKKNQPAHRFDGCVEHALAHIEEAIAGRVDESMERWYAVKLFERDEKARESLDLDPALIRHIEEDIVSCETEMDDDAESIITGERYNYIGNIIEDCYKKRVKKTMSMSDKIDSIVTNRFLALPIFAAVMFLVYYVSVTTVGTLLTDWTNDTLFGAWIIPGAQSVLEAIGCAPWLTGLLVDGIISGVGAVLGFVPQMLVLFLFLAFLEGCGYMARIAFIMDRIFRKFGLSGKSFIPMLIGTGCGVPGVMASRTIENDRDRKMTIMTTTFIPCGAKLPIIALIAGALFGGASWVAPSAYFVGIAAIICSGIILKKTKMFAGDPAPFVMELPAYHLPTVGNVLRSTWERGWSFIKKAGTIILLSTIFIWFAQSFGFEGGTFKMVENMENSILAAIGSGIAWIFTPLGWGNWKPAVAAITGLVAKENVVGTFGILYGFGEVAEDGAEIWGTLSGAMTQAAAYSFLVFNLLCAPCFAAMGAIKREMNNVKWFWFAIGYQTLLAYTVSLCVYQIGTWASTGLFGAGTIAALILIAAFLWLLFRPYQENRMRKMSQNAA
ncbi:MAG: ferrous iron transport protein B [Schaedlerella sp.]|uniref:ferrous iron transport protein B n=1 Tax=Mediterraneibacter glycyrrhizinilyticus TaxID=342942 RepID=UPI001D0891E9|nr:ferrous iron transport protein B [Mediterraneibacter glycyrrhizinilyticus]MCB6309559.1 ferrous iron transport protein B [Lachnospiraceae bacterium 210521-DFI.1.109]MCB6426860.1 ferrous iron transport protein B [Mediterraneibacter glycyrrhizinilyticus]